jgi:hypothetical protein
MRDVLWIGNCRPHSVLRTDAGFGQSIITRVKVLAILLHLGENILMAREFAIQTEEFLLLLSQFADINLVALCQKHNWIKYED